MDKRVPAPATKFLATVQAKPAVTRLMPPPISSAGFKKIQSGHTTVQKAAAPAPRLPAPAPMPAAVAAPVAAAGGGPGLPEHLFHRAPFEIALMIVESGGLACRSRDGGGPPYLCMADSEGGGASLGGRTTDVTFRVASGNLNAAHWRKEGAGAGGHEWRGIAPISLADLTYRLVDKKSNRAWKPAAALREDPDLQVHFRIMAFKAAKEEKKVAAKR